MKGVPRSIQGWMGMALVIIVILAVIARVPQIRQLIGM